MIASIGFPPSAAIAPIVRWMCGVLSQCTETYSPGWIAKHESFVSGREIIR